MNDTSPYSRWYRWLRLLRQFYTGSFVVWLVWILFIDDNNVRVVWSNYQKMQELEEEKEYYQEKITQVKKERDEVFGNRKLLEKWAREKYLMRKPTEDVYVIVDENNQPIESRKSE
ncbi:FtsB family cell division protein [Telluribacter sp.]|jgi:cell division protein FtsB|uniref:FtsB family cell division protein n=1 Tax=Telluribacter sp. TaxID=1978767 RepID=UPI002E128368|nr:septum formation initiator family protein [Telluribacter sp.]